jgi:hypothetical protein
MEISDKLLLELLAARSAPKPLGTGTPVPAGLKSADLGERAKAHSDWVGKTTDHASSSWNAEETEAVRAEIGIVLKNGGY